MKLVFRHGLSEANNRENVGTLAFANPTVPLMPAGREQAKAAGRLLVEQYGDEVLDWPVAVSTARRTSESASLMGLKKQASYPELDEVNHGLELMELRHMLDAGELPPAALIRAEQLLDHPPEERIWVTHGLVIAGLCKALDVYQDADHRLIARFCELRELPLD